MVVATLIPKDASHRLREKVKKLFRWQTTCCSLANRLQELNPLLNGWSNFYRHAWGAKKVFSSIDSYVWWTIKRWLRKKHRTSMKAIAHRYGWRGPEGGLHWQDGGIRPFKMGRRRVLPYSLGWMKTPGFANTCGEPDA
jgi:hypothetical protein